MFNPVFVSLSAKENPILEKKIYKRYVFIAFSSSYFKIVLALLAKVVIFYVQVSII